MNDGTIEELTPAERATLREMSTYDYYPFRQATCRKLLAKDLVESAESTISRVRVRPGYRLTAKGRTVAAAIRSGKQ